MDLNETHKLCRTGAYLAYTSITRFILLDVSLPASVKRINQSRIFCTIWASSTTLISVPLKFAEPFIFITFRNVTLLCTHTVGTVWLF